MKKPLRKFTFWFMVLLLFVIITAITPVMSGNCAVVFDTKPTVTTEEVTQKIGDILYTIKATTKCAIMDISLKEKCVTRYYYLIGHTKKDQVLMSVGHSKPSFRELVIVMGKYLLAIEEGI